MVFILLSFKISTVYFCDIIFLTEEFPAEVELFVYVVNSKRKFYMSLCAEEFPGGR
jgi:hypothetical protein